MSLFHFFLQSSPEYEWYSQTAIYHQQNEFWISPHFLLKTKCFPQTENVQVVSFFPGQVPSVLVGYVLFFGIGGYLHVIINLVIIRSCCGWKKTLFFNDNDESSFTMKFTITMMMVMMLLCPRWNTMWVSATRPTFGSANPTIGCLVGWEFPSSSSFSFETFKHQFLSYFVSSSILCTSQQWASNPQLTSQLHSLDDIWCNLN